MRSTTAKQRPSKACFVAACRALDVAMATHRLLSDIENHRRVGQRKQYCRLGYGDNPMVIRVLHLNTRS